MNDYIKREEAIGMAVSGRIRTEDGENWIRVEEVRESLKSVPAADARPVVRGEWEKYEDFDEYGGGRHVEWTCSKCFYIVKGDWEVRNSHINEKPRENFCPNCGADMREES